VLLQGRQWQRVCVRYRDAGRLTRRWRISWRTAAWQCQRSAADQATSKWWCWLCTSFSLAITACFAAAATFIQTTTLFSVLNNASDYRRQSLLSHTRTVVRECCKGDKANQWRNPKFDPLPRPNPVSDRNTYRHRWLRRGPLHLCKRSSWSAQAYRFCACVTLRTKNVSVFFFGGGVLANRYSQGPGTDFDAKYAKTRGSAQGCAFSGSRTQNLIPRPPFPRISAILGTILTGLRKFLPENRLTMGMRPLEHLLIVIVDA